MADNETLKDKLLNELRKPGFIKALSVFFFCAILGVILGFVLDKLQLFVTIGSGLGLLWMGVAYFNQKEEGEE